MALSKIRNINQVIEDSSFSKLMQKGLMINDLNTQLQRIFPVQFQGLYRVANVENGILSIEVMNAVVRQGVMFYQGQLLAVAQSIMPEIKELIFYVNPTLNNLKE